MLEIGYGGSGGPLLTWTAPARAFVLRTGSNREPFAWPERGVVFDIVNMKTGWCDTSAGIMPQWKWDRDKNHFEPKPGAKYKKGFSIPCAIGGGKTATWEQAGAVSWDGLAALGGTDGWMRSILGLRGNGDGAFLRAAAGRLPLVRLFGAQVKKYKKGSTTIPSLYVGLWVDRPACLGGDEPLDTVIANGEAAAAARLSQLPGEF